jgi:hypothetical protein
LEESSKVERQINIFLNNNDSDNNELNNNYSKAESQINNIPGLIKLEKSEFLKG